MSNKTRKIAVACFIFALAVTAAACHKANVEKIEKEKKDERMMIRGISFPEEDDGAEPVFKEAKAEDFTGAWKATSDYAKYLYGKIDLSIKNNGKWTGTVVDEKLKGTWKMSNGKAVLSSELFNVTIGKTEDDVIVMQETPNKDEDPINIVLTRKVIYDESAGSEK